ncbi:MAG: hypothetical protein E7490_10095 [Ruminococcaceae bacterium]|nr:hypothetical protein [Oscillospiraceae bacterium]
MKKITILILTLSMVLTLSACSDNGNSSTTDNNISSVSSSESEAELTFDEKFRGLDIDLRYDEVIELLGEPDEKGGVSVKYLSYKQDDGKSAIVQFLHGDNPRIDYTYITDSKFEEEEIILHRRICDHENDYCSHDIYYSDAVCDFFDKCKKIEYEMNGDEVKEILGEPYSIYSGSLTGTIRYFPDKYHEVCVITYCNGNSKEEGTNSFRVESVYTWDTIIHGAAVAILPEEYKIGEVNEKKPTKEIEQLAYDQKVSFPTISVSPKKDVSLKDYLNDYIGEYDEEIDEGDITKLVYKLSDGKLAHVCISNKEPEPIIEYAYVYDPETKKITSTHKVVEDCDYEKYLPDDTKD